MNWVDLIIVVFVFLCGYHGLKLGFIGSLFNVTVSVGSLIAAFFVYSPLNQFIRNATEIPEYLTPIISFALLFVLLRIVAGYLMHFVWGSVDLLLKGLPPLLIIDRILGSVLQACFGILVMSMIIVLFVKVPIYPDLQKEVTKSKIVSILMPQTVLVEIWLRQIIGNFPTETLFYLIPRQTKSEEILKMSFPNLGELKEVAEDERLMLDLVNDERKKVGVRELLWDESIVPVARAHSKDMFVRQYFAHTNPEGETSAERLIKGGVVYLMSGENLAYAPTVDLAHRGLMNSPGHKANILRMEFSRIGIGVVDAGVYGRMYTQNFAD